MRASHLGLSSAWTYGGKEDTSVRSLLKQRIGSWRYCATHLFPCECLSLSLFFPSSPYPRWNWVLQHFYFFNFFLALGKSNVDGKKGETEPGVCSLRGTTGGGGGEEGCRMRCVFSLFGKSRRKTGEGVWSPLPCESLRRASLLRNNCDLRRNGLVKKKTQTKTYRLEDRRIVLWMDGPASSPSS